MSFDQREGCSKQPYVLKLCHKYSSLCSLIVSGQVVWTIKSVSHEGNFGVVRQVCSRANCSLSAEFSRFSLEFSWKANLFSKKFVVVIVVNPNQSCPMAPQLVRSLSAQFTDAFLKRSDSSLNSMVDLRCISKYPWRFGEVNFKVRCLMIMRVITGPAQQDRSGWSSFPSSLIFVFFHLSNPRGVIGARRSVRVPSTRFISRKSDTIRPAKALSMWVE